MMIEELPNNAINAKLILEGPQKLVDRLRFDLCYHNDSENNPVAMWRITAQKTFPIERPPALEIQAMVSDDLMKNEDFSLAEWLRQFLTQTISEVWYHKGLGCLPVYVDGHRAL